MELREVVQGEVETIGGSATLVEAAERMNDISVGSLAVTVDRSLEGIFTERDVLRAVAEGADVDTATVGEWMTAYPDSVYPDMDVLDAADWMLAAGYRHLPVMDGGRLVGMASMKDILWAVTEGKR